MGRALSHNPSAPLHSSDVITVQCKTAFAIEHFGANLDSPHTKVRGKLVYPKVLGIVFSPLDSPVDKSVPVQGAARLIGLRGKRNVFFIAAWLDVDLSLIHI